MQFQILAMKQLFAKLTISLACLIIFIHAVVPHHHHDEDVEGFVFETELLCQCENEDLPCVEHHCHHHDGDCEEQGSRHPFDICKLQDLLSHLVLSSERKHLLIPTNPPAQIIFIPHSLEIENLGLAEEEAFYPPIREFSIPRLFEGRLLKFRAPPSC